VDRKRSLKLSILRALSDCGDYMLPDDVLFSQLRVTVRPPPTTSEIRSALMDLDADQKVIGVREDDLVRWKITAKGSAHLKEAEQV